MVDLSERENLVLGEREVRSWQTQNNYDNKNSLSLKNLLSTFFHQLEIVHVFRLCVRTGVIIFFCVCGK